jgi:hypothetical protein
MATRQSQIKVEVQSDTSGFNLDPAKRSLRDLQKDSAAAKAELAKLQLEFQEARNAAVQAGTAFDRSIGDDFKKKISNARTEISRLNAEVAKGVSKGLDDSGVGGKLSTSLASVQNIALGAAAAIATVTASVTGLASKINQIADFQDIAEKIGDTAANVSSLQRASDVSGVSLDTLAKASIKLTSALSKTDDEAKGVGQALSAIGLDLENFKQLSPVEQIDAVSKAFAGFEDGASKTAVAVALFGKSGADLIPLLNDLSDGYERQNILTNEQIKAADDLTKQYAGFKNELSALATTAAADTVPVLSELLRIIQQTVEYFGLLNKEGSIISTVFSGLKVVFETIVIVASDVIFVFKQIGLEIFGIGKQIAALATGDLKGFSAISDAMKADSKRAREELDKFQKELQFGLTSKGRTAIPNDPRLIGSTPASETVGAKKKLSFSTAPEVKAAVKKEVQLRADLSAKESEIQKQSLNEFKFISEEYKRLYAQNLISIEAYYAQQEALIQSQRETDNAAFLERQSQLQAEKARLETGGADPKEVLKVEEALQKAITDNQAKQLGYVTQLRGLEDSKVNAATKFNAELGKINQQYLEIQGLGASAEAQELRRLDIARQYEEQLKRIRAEKGDNSAEEAQVLAIQRQLAATQELAAAQTALKQSQTQNTIEQVSLQEQLNRGTISQVEAQVRMNELKAIAIEQEIALQQAATQNLSLSVSQRNEAAIKVAELQAALANLQPQLVDFGTQFKTLFQDRIGDALGDVLTRTKSFKDAFKSLLVGIAQDIIRSNINKALAGLFSAGFGGATGNLPGVVAGGPAFAEGGSVRGPGTSTSDSIPARLSDGEFVVKASSVQKYGVDFMNAINQGIAPAVRAFKNGGAVTRSPSVPQGFATGGMVSPASSSGDVNIQVINNSSQPVTAKQEQDPRTGLVSLILEDLNRGGPISRGINGITGTGRKPAY